MGLEAVIWAWRLGEGGTEEKEEEEKFPLCEGIALCFHPQLQS